MIRTKLKYLALITVSILGITGCSEAEPVGANTTEPTRQNSTSAAYAKSTEYSDLYLDSAKVEAFLELQNLSGDKSNNIRDFYKSRNYQFAWFTSAGLDEHGRAFWNLHNNFLDYSKDSSLYDKTLHRDMELLVNDEKEAAFDREKINQLELLLTSHFSTTLKMLLPALSTPMTLNGIFHGKKLTPWRCLIR